MCVFVCLHVLLGINLLQLCGVRLQITSRRIFFLHITIDQFPIVCRFSTTGLFYFQCADCAGLHVSFFEGSFVVNIISFTFYGD